MFEIWRNIQNYPNYSVSTYGRVRNDKTKKILKNQNIRGCNCVTVFNNGERKTFQINRLVSLTFKANLEKKEDDSSDDDSSDDDSSENLAAIFNQS
jgi:hypothetical protein